MKIIWIFLLISNFWSIECYKAGINDTILLEAALEEYSSTGVIPTYLQNILKNHHYDFEILDTMNSAITSKDITCNECGKAFALVAAMRKKGVSEVILRKLIIQTCIRLKFEDKNVCNGFLDPLMDVIFYMVDQQKNSTTDKLCSILLGPVCNNQFEYFNWTIDIPDKPTKIPEKIIPENEGSLRILQLTDIHYDPRYTTGAKAVCGEPLCCQDDQGIPENPSDGCGPWGDYRSADTPRKTLDDMIRHAQTQKLDYVYFTGDIIPHRVWSTSRENNSKLEREIMDLLRSKFDVPVVFVLGNHEAHPMNMYAPLDITDPTLSTEWLFDLLSSELKEFVGQGDFTHIEKGGFYSVLLKPGFRIIVLNNNICLTDNFWLAYEDYDLYGQLQWLTDSLFQSEKNGENVHILEHVPPGITDCLGTWGREYNKIIKRFSETVSAQFNGHTHYDEFFLFFNESTSFEAVSVAFNGASLATFTNNNPSYKIYEVNATNFNVEDFEEWTFNLTAANLEPEKETADWFKLYSFKEAYGLSSMKPEEIGNMVIEMAKNKTALDMYRRYKYRLGDGVDMVCDDDCNKDNLCRIVTTSLDDTFHCEEISKIYDGKN